MEEKEQKHTFEILYGLDIIPKMPDIPYMEEVVSTIEAILLEDKAKTNTIDEECYIIALEELKTILSDFKKFIETDRYDRLI